MTWSGLEPTIYHTRREHANHYTTNVVKLNLILVYVTREYDRYIKVNRQLRQTIQYVGQRPLVLIHVLSSKCLVGILWLRETYICLKCMEIFSWSLVLELIVNFLFPYYCIFLQNNKNIIKKSWTCSLVE